MSTVVPAMPQPEASSRETSLMTFFNPSISSQGSTQTTEAAQHSMQGQPLSRLYPSQQAVTVPIPRSTTVSAVSPLDELTSGTNFTTFSSMASTQPTAAAQPMPGQGIASLFQPQQAVTTPVPMSKASSTTSLSEELVRGASFTPILGAQGASLDSTPTFQPVDQDHGSYDPSSPLMFGENEPLVSSCAEISTPPVTSNILPNQLPAAESGAASLPDSLYP